MAVAADISKREDIERMVQEVVAKFGRLDIAVSNAGIEIREPFFVVMDDHWHKVLSVNLYGAFVFSRGCGPPDGEAGQRRQNYFHLIGA